MGFFIGIFFGAMAMLIFAGFIDSDASTMYERLEIGEMACESHGGLSRWDYADNFTCKDGSQISNYKSKSGE